MLERENNAFQFEEVEYNGPRSNGPKNEINQKIYQTLTQMEVSKTKCFYIPKDMIDKENNARQAVAYQRDAVRKNYPSKKDISVSTQAVKDAEGNYKGLRVWRIA